ncbi:MAG TPA: selenocysteine-specific translation elongation factor [Pyrinomonadaceae bacterium]|nr:selenocysteine-specific translation elongation factor [Pyrinomonadaceae bacterium]
MEIVVGTAGHIDHGKTALVRALTGTDADRLPEEKQRGITIDIGFAELAIGPHHFAFIDVPGHERFVKNMLAGASGIDIVMLIIAADEGVMPQTREHFEICRLLGISTGIVVLTKSDLVDAETLELAQLDAADLVAGSFLEHAQVIAASSVTGAGLDELSDVLSSMAETLTVRNERHVPFLPIDRSFALKGFGTVVTGTLSGGEIPTGAEMEILPQGRRVRIRGLQTHGRSVDTARPGQRTAVNLAGIDHHDFERGMVLVPPSRLLPTQIFDARVEVLEGSKRPLRTRQRVRVHIGTAEVLARLAVPEPEGEIAPGGRGFVQFRLEHPIAGLMNERFVVRSYSPQTTIAGGEVILPHARKQKRLEHPAHRELLQKLLKAKEDPAAVVGLFVEAKGEGGLDSEQLRAQTGWREDVLSEALRVAVENKTLTEIGSIFINPQILDGVSGKIIAAIERFHQSEPLASGISRETLRGVAGRRVPGAVVDGVIDRMASEESLRIHGELISAAAHSIELSAEEESAKGALIKIYSNAGLAPQKLDDSIGDAAARSGIPASTVRKVFNLLVKQGDLRKVTEEFYFGADAIDQLTEKLRQFDASSADRTIDVSAFKDLAGISRKYAIPLLEYFDRERVTVRTGDKRQILV